MSVPNLITCEVDGIQYLLHPQILGSTEALIKADQIIPVLLLTEEELNGTPNQIGQLLQYYVDTDDVCSSGFTDILVEKPAKQTSCSPVFDRRGYTPSNRATYRLVRDVAGRTGLSRNRPGHGTEDGAEDDHEDDPKVQDEDNGGDDDNDNLPSGPYFLSGPNLHQAYRLYPDTQDAFVYGMIPNDVYSPFAGFKSVSFLAQDSMSKTIPVPSRHYHRFLPTTTIAAQTQDSQKRKKKRTNASPSIRGKRITLTDGLQVLGTQTTLSCKAYVQTYPVSTETDVYVQRLLREGAVLVGKTKTSQLRIRNSLWPDTHFPANPRAAARSARRRDVLGGGNGSERGAGTGTGSASAVAGYAWLEGAVGGDVDSVVRESGKGYGLYGLRRRLGNTDTDNENDNDNDKSTTSGPDGNVGIFGRSLYDLSLIAESTFPPPVLGSDSTRKESSDNNTVKRILYLDYGKDEKLESAMDVFVNALERHLQVERTTVNLDEEWEKHRVMRGLEFSLGETARLLYDLNHYHKYADFRKDYQEKFHSSRGLADLEAQVLWSSARAHLDQQKQLQDQVQMFREWFEQHILLNPKDTTGSREGDTIIVIPDVSFHQKGHILGFSGRMLAFEDMLSSQMATPQLSVPFTQIPGKQLGEEQTYTPVVASVIGPKMTDKPLITLIAEALTASGLPISVQPGPLCFPLPPDNTIVANNNNNNNKKKKKTGTARGLHDFLWMFSDEQDDKSTAGLNEESGLRGSEDDLDERTLAESSLSIEVDLRF